MKMFFVSICLAGLALSTGSATAFEGLNLSWDDCGTFGVSNKAFACDRNDGGPEVLVASFATSQDLPNFYGLAAQIDVRSASSMLPDWWRHGDFVDPSGCRDTTGMGVDGEGTSCPSATVGRRGIGFVFDIGFESPNRGRIRIEAVNENYVPSRLTPNLEHVAARIILYHSRSSGIGACDGCQVPICIVFNSVLLGQLVVPPDVTITNVLNRNHVTWQSPTIPGCPESTGARSRTWGFVKSLYR